MMNTDRFKFRYFCKTTKFMGEVIYLNIKDDYALVRFEYADEFTPDEEVKISDGVLMQCTGAKDMSDKLIYEGDIVHEKLEYDNENGETICEHDKHIVLFQECGFQLAVNCDHNNIESIYPMQEMVSETLDHLQVIGNIHQNPELLNNI